MSPQIEFHDASRFLWYYLYSVALATTLLQKESWKHCLLDASTFLVYTPDALNNTATENSSLIAGLFFSNAFFPQTLILNRPSSCFSISALDRTLLGLLSSSLTPIGTATEWPL